MKLKLITLLIVLYGMNTAARAHGTPIPTDTTTSLIDRSAALIMIDEGRKFYDEGRNRDAIIKFRQAAIKDPNSWKGPFWVARCHYNLNNYGYALQYANEAISKEPLEVDQEVYELLGKSYHRLGMLDSALVNYRIALEKLSSNRARELRVQHHIDECLFAQKALASEPEKIKMHLSGDINSGYNDYSPVLTDGGKTIYFVSRRANTTGGGQNPDDQEYFEDIYRGTYDLETEQFDSITNSLGRLNSEGFDALSYLSPDGLFGLMTLNTTKADTRLETDGSDICEVEFTDKGQWSSPKLIKNKSINTSYFEGAATMTADGNTMYFVTDRKADKTLSDIYFVQKNGKKWGEAKPLPAIINSEGNETTPYITPDGRYLFFSSDGHLGMGGYDIYVSENMGDTWSTPVNLGPAFNTVNNDTHFQYYPDLQTAVMATFQIIGEKASLDIYKVDMSSFRFPQ